MKAVIYARYSSDNQREESIEGQLRECKEYAERNGILVLQSYIDRALSAKTDNRPEFQRMIRDSAKGLFDTVLVWKLDRFARNRYDSAHYKSQLRKNGVKVVSATESIADGPEGIILESMLEGMAEYYSAELAQKVNRGMRENALKARSNGGTIPLGYRLDEEHRLKIDPLTAPVVREVFQRYADGENLRTIIRSLNERGIRTSRNYPFRHSSFNTMLKNRKYIGEYHYKDVVIPDAVPPIISKELFERVQERMKKNQHAPARAKAEEEYLLTTKLFCGHCGRLMIGESGKGRNGTIHRYYKCAGAKRRLGCHKKAVKKDWIERVAVLYAIQRVFQDDLIAQIADELVALQGAEDSALPLLRRQLADTERGIENMLNAIQQGIFTSSTRQRLEELENLRTELKSSILQAELERPQYSREDIIQWISRFKGGDPNDKAYQRQIIDIFLNSIYVFDDKLVFTYNYKKGSQTVSLDEVFAAFGSDSRAGASPESRMLLHSGFLFYSPFAAGGFCPRSRLLLAERGSIMENSSFSCRFSLYPMDSDFVSIILGALDATDTGAVTSASDAMSTIYTGPQNSVLDGVEGLFGNAFRPGVHMALEGQFTWKGQPGAETGAAPNRAANPDRHFPMLCKVTVYPVERMVDAVELARQAELQPAQAADTLRLQGDVQQVFGYLDRLCSLLRQQNAAGAHFTISVNSPTAE